ncbi:MAG: hypothetical protein ABIM50_04345 [Novosphingobium sp.]
MASEPPIDLAFVRTLRDKNDALMKENEALKTGDGGGNSGGMDGRVAKLEAHVEILRSDVGAIKKDVGDIRVGLATLTERVAHLPGKGFIITATSSGIGLLIAVVVFADKIRAFLALN